MSLTFLNSLKQDVPQKTFSREDPKSKLKLVGHTPAMLAKPFCKVLPKNKVLEVKELS